MSVSFRDITYVSSQDFYGLPVTVFILKHDIAMPSQAVIDLCGIKKIVIMAFCEKILISYFSGIQNRISK